jgi:hypothetical protein
VDEVYRATMWMRRECDGAGEPKAAQIAVATKMVAIANRILSCLIVRAPDLLWLVVSTNCASVMAITSAHSCVSRRVRTGSLSSLCHLREASSEAAGI